MKQAFMASPVLIVILLCSGCQLLPYEYCLHHVHVHSACQPYSFKGKYIGTPTLYYANSVSTFQTLLMISGDINPNPGPDNDRSVSLEADTVHNVQYTYDTQTLRSFNGKHTSIRSTWRDFKIF